MRVKREGFQEKVDLHKYGEVGYAIECRHNLLVKLAVSLNIDLRICLDLVS